MKKIIEKTNETKSWLFEKIKNIHKPLGRLIKKKEKSHINKIRNEKGATMDTKEILMITRDYYKHYMPKNG